MIKITVITDVFLETRKSLYKRGSTIVLYNIIKHLNGKKCEFTIYQMGNVNKSIKYKNINVTIIKADNIIEYKEKLKKIRFDFDIIHYNNIDLLLPKLSPNTATIHTNSFIEKEENKELLINLSKKINKIIVVNKIYLETFKNDIQNLFFIQNGIDTTFFTPSKKIKENKKIFFPNKPTSKKNGDFAYELIKKIGKEYKLYIVDEKREGSRNIIYLGKSISPKKMLKIYKKCFHVIIPSLSESCSLCSLEAMAMKRNLLVNKIPGMAEYVKYNLIEKLDVELWIDNIKNIDTNLVKNNIEENYKSVIDNNSEKMSENYYLVWKGLLNEKER